MFNYVYDSNNIKCYYDSAKNEFFYVDSYNYQVWLKDLSSVKYKKIVEVDDTNKPKTYYQQLISNGSNEFQVWEFDSINNEYKTNDDKTTEYSSIVKDYSGRNYCIESFAFTTWFNNNIGSKTWKSNIATKYDEDGKPIEFLEIESGTFNIIYDTTENNNPDPENEEEYLQSAFALHKRQVMKNSIETNLKRAVSDANSNLDGINYEYRLPELNEEDWDKLLNNVSILGFLQGVPIGLKYYNNYAISSSSRNNEYVDPKGIYLTSNDDTYYHRRGCNSLDSGDVVGYRNTDFIVKTVGDKSYFMHDNPGNTNSELACYNCLVDSKGNNSNTTYEKEYYTALARERYISQKHITPNISVPIEPPIARQYSYTVRYVSKNGEILQKHPGSTTKDPLPYKLEKDKCEYNGKTYYHSATDPAEKNITRDKNVIDFIFEEYSTQIEEELKVTIQSIKSFEMDTNENVIYGSIESSQKGFAIIITGGRAPYIITRKGSTEKDRIYTSTYYTTDDKNVNSIFGENEYIIKDDDGNGNPVSTGIVYDLTISKNEDMKSFRDYVNGDTSKFDELLNKSPENNNTINIVADGFEVDLGEDFSNLIGNSESKAFSKILEGNGHTFKVTGRGLFGYNSGTIQNLTVNADDINVSTEENVGGVAAHNKGTITKVNVTGKITNNSLNEVDLADTTKNTGTGGIAGYNENNIEKCINSANITCRTNGGGIAGINVGGSITNCINEGEISCRSTGNTFNRIGGIVGVQGGIGKIQISGKIRELISNQEDIITDKKIGQISNCANKGNITGNYVNQQIFAGEVNHSQIGIGGIAGVCDDMPVISDITDEDHDILDNFLDKIRNGAADIDTWFENVNIGMWEINNCYSSGLVNGGKFTWATDEKIDGEIRKTANINPSVGGILGFNYTNSQTSAVNNCFYQEKTVNYQKWTYEIWFPIVGNIEYTIESQDGGMNGLDRPVAWWWINYARRRDSNFINDRITNIENTINN